METRTYRGPADGPLKDRNDTNCVIIHQNGTDIMVRFEDGYEVLVPDIHLHGGRGE